MCNVHANHVFPRAASVYQRVSARAALVCRVLRAVRTRTVLCAAGAADMTVTPEVSAVTRISACCNQLLTIILMSFGLAMGWMSLASGESGESGESVTNGTSKTSEASGNEGMALGAVMTFCAQLVGVPLSARAAAAGRRPALILTSAAFVVCWTLKLCGGGWWVLCARAAAGLAGAGAWTLAPLLATEMCSENVRGAATASLVLAHNLGFLLMYLAADFHIPHRMVLYSCLGLSASHCVMYFFMPESPAYLAANGRVEEACASLAWLRGLRGRAARDPAMLRRELARLPPPDTLPASPFKLFRDMLSDVGRRRAFLIACVAVVGQESCGVHALLQFAERVFVAARDEAGAAVAGADGASAWLQHATPARRAVLLGAVQLVASALALYLVERLGRRPLLVLAAWATAAALGAGALAAQCACAGPVTLALAAAVAADSAGLQPASYAILTDMFDYQYRGCAVVAAGVLSSAGAAAEAAGAAGVLARAGLAPALLAAALITAALAVLATLFVPETKGREPHEIYAQLAPAASGDAEGGCCERGIKGTFSTHL